MHGAPQFPLIEVRGDARARGHAHGESARERVRQTFDFYMHDLFVGGPLDSAAIRARAARIAEITHDHAPLMAEEIAGIAAGSGLAAWQIYVLNARTEILNARVDECSALYLASSRILAQNWDWVEPLEALALVIRHQHADGRRHVSFCEPGMVAKIGLNDAGIGVCLNILFAPHDLSGLPVHILIGSVLQARDFAQARAILTAAGLGKASHLLVADAAGNAVSMEYFGDAVYALEPRDGVLLHTNHCLGRGADGRTAELANSCARYDRLQALVAATTPRGVAAVKDILLCADDGENALMRAYQAQNVLGNHRVGTCASIIMELAEGRFHVRRGPGRRDEFMTVTV